VTPSKGRLVAVARGLDAAQKAIHAMADREDGRALAILNAQSFEDSLWTSAYLLGCLHQMATVFTGGDPKEASRLLHAGADGLTDDVSVTQAEVIVSDAFNRLTGA
jgi:hypothetical protein